MAQAEATVTPAVISLQGKVIRSRVPSDVLSAAGGEDGDAINWTVQTHSGQHIIVGQVVKGGADAVRANRQPPVPKSRAAAPAKTATPKLPGKGKAASKADDLSALFGAPAAAPKATKKAPALPTVKTAAPKAAPKAVAAPKVVAPPKTAAPRLPVATPTGAPRLPGAAKGKGGVRYKVPE